MIRAYCTCADFQAALGDDGPCSFCWSGGSEDPRTTQITLPDGTVTIGWPPAAGNVLAVAALVEDTEDDADLR